MDHDRDTLGEDFVAVQEVTDQPRDQAGPAALPRPPTPRTSRWSACSAARASTTWRAIEKLPAADPQYCHPAPPPDPKKTKQPAPPPKDPTTAVFAGRKSPQND